MQKVRSNPRHRAQKAGSRTLLPSSFQSMTRKSHKKYATLIRCRSHPQTRILQIPNQTKPETVPRVSIDGRRQIVEHVSQNAANEYYTEPSLRRASIASRSWESEAMPNCVKLRVRCCCAKGTDCANAERDGPPPPQDPPVYT
jgi:hypothetical protein